MNKSLTITIVVCIIVVVAVVLGLVFMSARKIAHDTNILSSWDEAVVQGDVPKMKALSAEAALVTARGSMGETALMFAAKRGSVEGVRLLLDKGVDVNVKTKDGNSALKIAVKKGYTDIADLLRKAGAKE
jgi:ankyrin repeat protein